MRREAWICILLLFVVTAASPTGQDLCNDTQSCLTALELVAADGPGITGEEQEIAEAVQAFGSAPIRRFRKFRGSG